MSDSDSDAICDECHKKFVNKRYLDIHISKGICKSKPESKIYSCKFCNKVYTTSTSMYRHMKHACKSKPVIDEKHEIYEKLLKQNAELLSKLEHSEVKNNTQIMKNSNNTNNTNNINNNIVNIGTIVVKFGEEDLSKLDKSDVIKLLNGYNTAINLTKLIHFNPKHPEFHNVYIPNMRAKYAMMYNGSWDLIDRQTLINAIYDNKKNYVENNLDEFILSLTQSKKDALIRWLDTDDDHKKIKEVKENIKLVLYNSRNIPMETRGIQNKPVKAKAVKNPKLITE